MPYTKEQIAIREAERAALFAFRDAAFASWHCGHIDKKQVTAFADTRFPSLTPRPEKVTLGDGSEWEYAPHIDDSYAWGDPFGERWAFPQLYITYSTQERGTRLPPIEARKAVDAMDRYHARECK